MSPFKVALAVLLAGGISIGTAIVGERLLSGAGSRPDASAKTGERLQALPALRLPDLAGREVSSETWAGKILVLSWWATWCPDCIRGMPAMIRAQEALGGRGVQFVGIAVDRPRDVESFLVDRPVNYPILIANPEAVELSRRLGNRFLGLPFTAIFDARGRWVYSRIGELGADELKAQLDVLLGDSPGPDRGKAVPPKAPS